MRHIAYKENDFVRQRCLKKCRAFRNVPFYHILKGGGGCDEPSPPPPIRLCCPTCNNVLITFYIVLFPSRFVQDLGVLSGPTNLTLSSPSKDYHLQLHQNEAISQHDYIKMDIGRYK